MAHAWTADDEIVASDKSSAEEDRRCYYSSWLENYLEQLEGKEAYIQFQERYYSTPEYRVEPKMTGHDEEVNGWIGVFIAVVGVTLMVLSALDGVPF